MSFLGEVILQTKLFRMQNEQQKKTTRKKFLLLGAGLVSAFAFLKLSLPGKKKKETVKLLTRDGRLVEVDMTLAKRTGKKISAEEILRWVENKPTIQ